MNKVFGPVRDALIAHPAALNLVVVSAIVLVGAIVWLTRPLMLRKEPKSVRALDFWLVQWILLDVLYIGRVARPSETPLAESIDWTVLTLVDLQTAFSLAFCYSYLRGRELQPMRAWGGALVFFGGMFAYNLMVYNFADIVSVSAWRYIWILPSAFLSSLALLSIGGVFTLRLGSVALPLFAVTSGYALLQWPVYINAAVKGTFDARWFVALGLGKILFGGIFYIYFLAPLSEFGNLLTFRCDEDGRAFILRHGKGIIGLIGALVVSIIGTIFGSFLL